MNIALGFGLNGWTRLPAHYRLDPTKLRPPVRFQESVKDVADNHWREQPDSYGDWPIRRKTRCLVSPEFITTELRPGLTTQKKEKEDLKREGGVDLSNGAANNQAFCVTVVRSHRHCREELLRNTASAQGSLRRTDQEGLQEACLEVPPR